MYNQGISKEGDVLDKAVDFRIVQKSGTWFSYNELRLGQGRENAKSFLRENPEVFQEIEKQVRVKLGLEKGEEAEAEKEE